MGGSKNFNNFANQITLVRVLLLPFLLYFAYTKNLYLFIIIYALAGFTDGLDGFVARKLNLATDFGAKFDSIADDSLLVSILISFFLLRFDLILKFKFLLISVFALFTFRLLLLHFKFKNKTRLHLISDKISAIFVYLGVLILLVFDIESVLLVAIVLGIIALSEEIFIMLTQKTISHDTKTIFDLI